MKYLFLSDVEGVEIGETFFNHDIGKDCKVTNVDRTNKIVFFKVIK